MLAIRLQLTGWDISRESVAKIESRVVRVGDHRLYFLANVFNVPIPDLLPAALDPHDPNLNETMDHFMSRRC